MWAQFFPQLSTLRKKEQAAEIINAYYRAFVVTADGSLGHEAKAFMHLLADKFTAILQMPHSEVLGYAHARML